MQATIRDMCHSIFPPRLIPRADGDIVKIIIYREQVGNFALDICPQCSKKLLKTIYENNYGQKTGG